MADEQHELQPLLIVADNYRMAGDYAREHGVQRWVYASDTRPVLGRRNGRFVQVTTGDLTAREVDRRREILAMLRVAGFIEEA